MKKCLSFQLLLLRFLAVSCLITNSSCLDEDSDNSSFYNCLSSKLPEKELQQIVYTPKSTNYTAVLEQLIRNNRLKTPTTPKPTTILTPFHESQVQAIVTCARQSRLLLKIRSGGHDYEGLSYTCTTKKTRFAVLDMLNLRDVTISPSEKTAWVGAGATMGELYYRIWEKSPTLGFPGGVCPTLGAGGHISGGGYGNLMRKYGLSVDNVLDAKIVDAEGRILDRKSMGEDLFWAIRGGGGASFGVVLSYKLNLVPVPKTVTVFNVQRTLEENATDIVYKWQFVADKFDKELFVRVFLQPTNGTNGKNTVRASFIALYLGDSKTLISLMNAKFPELGLKPEDCKETTWIKSTMFWAYFPDNSPETALLNRTPSISSAFKMKSDYVRTPIPRNNLSVILEKMVGGSIWMMFNPYGGRMSEISSDETAYPHRAGNIYKIQYLLYWNEKSSEDDEKNINSMRRAYDYMTPFVSKNPRQAFLNYRDIDIGSSDVRSVNGGYENARVYGVRYFKGNFERLVRVKSKVDPTNFFRNEQSIPVKI